MKKSQRFISGEAADATIARVQRQRTGRLRARLGKEARARMMKLERVAQKMTFLRTLRRKPNLCKMNQKLSRRN